LHQPQKGAHHDLPRCFFLTIELLEREAEQGYKFLPEPIRIVGNLAMHVGRQKHLGVSPDERFARRYGYGNGFKPKTVNTRIVPITNNIPQVREGGFYPQILEKGLHSKRVLMLAMTQKRKRINPS
jgi:transposase-like protein